MAAMTTFFRNAIAWPARDLWSRGEQHRPPPGCAVAGGGCQLRVGAEQLVGAPPTGLALSQQGRPGPGVFVVWPIAIRPDMTAASGGLVGQRGRRCSQTPALVLLDGCAACQNEGLRELRGLTTVPGLVQGTA